MGINVEEKKWRELYLGEGPICIGVLYRVESTCGLESVCIDRIAKQRRRK
ncbi:uncharacterized protein G2W53_018864 [Senna tora]|uniref:Uncharacterized protein n=1 Tax=Senna tora TaxID=362788 RepID=A0A834TSL4_9FABA|nr:uncharacterized protein G2W53_018864 [Senna tora]